MPRVGSRQRKALELKIVHRFYDLLIGGAEVVILHTARALAEHEHVLIFSRYARSWISDSLSELPNVRLLRIDPTEASTSIAQQNADLHCFHYYPPMSESDFRNLPSRVLSSTVIVNHWHTELPLILGAKYVFLSEESRNQTGVNIPFSSGCVLINPVDTSFFDIRRTPLRHTVGRHSRAVSIKFSDDFFVVAEAIQPSRLTMMVLGSLPKLVDYVGANVRRLANSYWFLPFGSLRVTEFLRYPEIYLYQTRHDFAETCPMNILEAMAAGVPIVAERKGGIIDLIKHGESGMLCDDRDDFVNYSNRLFDDETARKRIADCAQQWAFDHASLSRYGAKFLQAMDTLFAISLSKNIGQ